MSFLDRNREARQLIIDYKRTFATPHGKSVLMDLMNRFHIVNSAPDHESEFKNGVRKGETDVVKHIMRQANFSVRRLDELLKGVEADVDSSIG